MTMRIGTGLASGMDTEAIITAILGASSYQKTRWSEDIQKDTDKYSAWTDLQSEVSDLRDVTKQLSSYSTWAQMDAISTDEDVLTASADSTADAESYNVTVGQLATADTYKSNSQSVDSTSALGYEGSFTLNGQTITVGVGSSLVDIAKAINSASGSMTTAVKAQVIGTSLVIKNASTGTGSDISMSSASGTAFSDLGLDVSGNHTAAKDCTGTIDSVSFVSKSNTNVENLLKGVSLNFKDTGTSTLSIGHDTTTIKSLLTDFIASYNEIMENISDYSDVTLSGSGNTTKGESISSVGVLQGDYLASSIQRLSRSILTSSDTNPNEMNQAFNNLGKIGIWTSGEDNQLALADEDTLDDALANNFDEVEDLFRATKVEDGEVVGVGVMRRLDDYLYSLIDPVEGSIIRKETSLTNHVNDLNDKIDDLDRKLAKQEEELYAHFSAYESMTSTISSNYQFLLKSIGA